jgi:hypothetical protein
MKKIIGILIAMMIGTIGYSQNNITTLSVSSTCATNTVTVNFYMTGMAILSSQHMHYRVLINSSSPFWQGGTALGSPYSPSSGGYLKNFSSTTPGSILVTIPNTFVGMPYIGVALYDTNNVIQSIILTPSGGQQITVYSPTIATPTITVAGNTSLCQGSSVTLTSSPAYAYSWSNGSTASSITVSPSATTTYSLTASNPPSCSSNATTTKTINIISTPTASISPNSNQIMCQGSTISLTASGGTSYSWNNGTSAASIVVSPTALTSYYATVSNGCPSQNVSTQTVQVTVNPTPTVSISGTNTICNGQNTTLSASGGTTYSWSPGGATTSSILVSPTTGTIYSVTGTNANSCTNTSTSAVVVNPLAVANAGTDVTIMIGNNTTLNGSGNGTYNWNPATGLSCTTCANPTANPTTTITYTLSTTNSCGTAIDSVAVTVVPNTTGIFEHKQASEILLYPNPNNGNFTITTKEIAYELIITNILGEKILSQKIQSEKSEIDLSSQPQGIYFLQLNNNEISKSEKIIIIK